jgi:hypothetical protein
MQYHIVEWNKISEIVFWTIKYKDFNLGSSFLYQEEANAQSFHIAGLEKPLWLEEVEAPRMSWRSTHEYGNVSAQRTAAFTLRI